MINSISAIDSLNRNQFNSKLNSKKASVPCRNYTDATIFTERNYNINFTGLSLAREYQKTSQYLAALILDSNHAKYNTNGSQVSAKHITETIERLFKLNSVYLPFTMADETKIKWKNYIPQEVREYSVNKINDARIDRFNTWKNFLENSSSYTDKKYDTLIREIEDDDCLKFVIWNAMNSDIKTSNRHIPVPFDIDALLKTVTWLNSIEPENRKLQAVSAKEFLKMYTHKLKDELLMHNPQLITTKEYIPDANSYWVKIPSIKKDPHNSLKNISSLEKLSNENWCTRSSVDKAEAALTDGDFYLFLRRDKDSQVWQTVLGMTSYKGAIDQIQGANNDNLIPLKEIDNIKNFLAEHRLKCTSGNSVEGPKALQQIMIAEKLKEVDNTTNMSLSAAISKRNIYAIFNILGYEPKAGYNPYNVYNVKNNLLEIKNYKTGIILDQNRGIKVPLSYLGINEDELLKPISVIHGDFILADKSNSEITTFPPNLYKVEGKIVCTREQYLKFKDDMLRVADSPHKIIVTQ